MIQTKKIKKSKSQFDRRGHVVTLRGMRVIQTSKCSSGQFNLTNYRFYNKINNKKLDRRLERQHCTWTVTIWQTVTW